MFGNIKLSKDLIKSFFSARKDVKKYYAIRRGNKLCIMVEFPNEDLAVYYANMLRAYMKVIEDY